MFEPGVRCIFRSFRPAQAVWGTVPDRNLIPWCFRVVGETVFGRFCSPEEDQPKPGFVNPYKWFSWIPIFRIRSLTEAAHQISALVLLSFFLWTDTKFRSAILRYPWWSYRETFVRFTHPTSEDSGVLKTGFFRSWQKWPLCTYYPWQMLSALDPLLNIFFELLKKHVPDVECVSW